jgi:subtilase family serine protease
VPKGEDGAAFRNMLRDTYVNLKPVVAAENTAESRSNTGVVVAIVIAIVVIIAVVAFLVLRRRPRSVEE